MWRGLEVDDEVACAASETFMWRGIRLETREFQEQTQSPNAKAVTTLRQPRAKRNLDEDDEEISRTFESIATSAMLEHQYRSDKERSLSPASAAMRKLALAGHGCFDDEGDWSDDGDTHKEYPMPASAWAA